MKWDDDMMVLLTELTFAGLWASSATRKKFGMEKGSLITSVVKMKDY